MLGQYSYPLIVSMATFLSASLYCVLVKSHRVKQITNEKNKLEAFNDTGLCLLSNKEANEYISLL